MLVKSSRLPAVAGRFYPADKNELKVLVCNLVEKASQQLTNFDESVGRVKAIIAPHAGYAYSGSIAATAYAWLRQAGVPNFERVVLVGPTHYHSIKGVALPSVSEFVTPLGNVSVDAKAITDLCLMDFVNVVDEVHALDHAIEVHLPFLQTTLEKPFVIVPLLVGNFTAGEFSDVLGRLWGGPETLIVISSDLSHFFEYGQARSMDAFVSKAIEELAPQDIEVVHACGRIPIQGLLLQARYHGLKAVTVDLRNSGNTAGGRDKVVGYGAYVFSEPTTDSSFDESQRRELMETARWSLTHGVEHGSAPEIGFSNRTGKFGQKRATFVTLRIGEELRGCMGSVMPVRALGDDVVQNGYAAGFLDPRFGPVSANELKRIQINISVLSPLQELIFASEFDLVSLLRPHIDGMVIEEGHRRGILLPSVWEMIADPQRFFRELKQKAGLSPDYWSSSLRVFRYTAESFSEVVI